MLGRVVAGMPLSEVLAHVIYRVEALSGERMYASILLVDASGKHLVHGAAPSLPASYNEAIDGLEFGPMSGSCGAAAYNAVPVIVDDIETDPLWEPFRDLALNHGLRACWSAPTVPPTAACSEPSPTTIRFRRARRTTISKRSRSSRA
ncbi:GAF domain-containing protein [Caballeronia arationis]|uniref:GAF domain-containing protein n=1 Tax=Caballeronia arationis TaxID=1777142 RepID=UPI001F30D69F|nr:GAF domain-containing protein [Caballeronia arationis]